MAIVMKDRSELASVLRAQSSMLGTKENPKSATDIEVASALRQLAKAIEANSVDAEKTHGELLQVVIRELERLRSSQPAPQKVEVHLPKVREWNIEFIRQGREITGAKITSFRE